MPFEPETVLTLFLPEEGDAAIGGGTRTPAGPVDLASFLGCRKVLRRLLGLFQGRPSVVPVKRTFPEMEGQGPGPLLPEEGAALGLLFDQPGLLPLSPRGVKGHIPRCDHLIRMAHRHRLLAPGKAFH